MDPACGDELILFMSNGLSLTRWRAIGLQSREILLYREFLRRGLFKRVTVLSYDPADHDELHRLRSVDPLFSRLKVITPPASRGRLEGVAGLIWSLRTVWAERDRLRSAAWLKTNQISGAWAAVLAARLTGRPLLVRLGYVLSERFARQQQPVRAATARLLEQVAYATATRIVATSAEAVLHIRRRPAATHKVSLLPTYVDVGLFSPKTAYDFDAPVVTVGRLEPVKNYVNLALACRKLGRELHIYGAGSQESELRALAAEPGSPVILKGLLANEELAVQLRAYSIFALTSRYEGLPKALIEAMALGLVCVGTDVRGINELISDGDTGYLSPSTEVADIAQALARAIAERNTAVGRRARAKIESGFSLERYVAGEAAIFGAPLRSPAPAS